MSSNLKLYRRIVVAQKSTHNVLDLQGHEVRASVGGSRQSEFRRMGDGTAFRESRRETVQIPLLEQEHHDLAALLEGLKCDCICLAVANKHLAFYEPTKAHLEPESGDAGNIAADILRLSTSNRYAAVAEADDFLAGTPWNGATIGIASTLEQLNTQASDKASSVDVVSIGPTASDLLSVAGDGGVYEIINGGGAVFTNADLDNAQGIGYDGTNLVVADANEPEIVVISTTGTTQSTNVYVGNTPGGLSYHIDKGLAYVADVDGTVRVLDGTSGFSQLRQFTIDDGSTPKAVLVDGDQILVSTSDGNVEVWQVEDGSESFLGRYDERASAWDGIAFHDSALFSLTTGNANLDVVSRWKLRMPSQTYYLGPAWRTRKTFAINADGTSPDLSTTYPAVLRLPFPMLTATVQFDGITGTVEAFDPDGNSLGVVTGTDPVMDLSTSGDLSASDLWELRVVVDSTSKRPSLVVSDPGSAQGAIVRDTQTNCASGDEAFSGFFLSDSDKSTSGSGGTSTAELSVEVVGQPASGAIVRRFVPVAVYSITTDGVAWAGVAPSGDVTVDVTKNGSKVGEWSIGGGNNFGNFTRTVNTLINDGDVVRIVWPTDAKGMENVVLGVRLEEQ